MEVYDGITLLTGFKKNELPLQGLTVVGGIDDS